MGSVENTKLHYSRPVFFLIDAALLVATIMPIIALNTPSWLVINYKTQSFAGITIDVTIRMGIWIKETISGSLTQKDFVMWCAAPDGNTDPTPWCGTVEAVKGLCITAIVLGCLSLSAFTLSLGKPHRRVALACTAATLLSTIAVWIASGLWGDVKSGYCTSFSTGYLSRTCSFGSSFVENTASGFFFLVAAVALAFGKTVVQGTGGGASSCLEHII